MTNINKMQYHERKLYAHNLLKKMVQHNPKMTKEMIIFRVTENTGIGKRYLNNYWDSLENYNDIVKTEKGYKLNI